MKMKSKRKQKRRSTRSCSKSPMVKTKTTFFDRGGTYSICFLCLVLTRNSFFFLSCRSVGRSKSRCWKLANRGRGGGRRTRAGRDAASPGSPQELDKLIPMKASVQLDHVVLLVTGSTGSPACACLLFVCGPKKKKMYIPQLWKSKNAFGHIV